MFISDAVPMRVQKSQGHSSSQVKGTLGRREESTETPVGILDSDVNTMPRVSEPPGYLLWAGGAGQKWVEWVLEVTRTWDMPQAGNVSVPHVCASL